MEMMVTGTDGSFTDDIIKEEVCDKCYKIKNQIIIDYNGKDKDN